MAVARSSGVRTESEFVQDVLGSNEDTVQESKHLGPNDVETSDGRVVTLRKTNALDDTRIDSIIFDAYANRMTGIVAPSITLRSQALNAIYEIDGHPQRYVQSQEDLESLMQRFESDDMDVIAEKYLEVIGKKKKLEQALKEMQEASRSKSTF